MTVCNMSIEAGAKAGLVAPDDTTFAYLDGRAHAPQGEAWEAGARRLAHAAQRRRRGVGQGGAHRRRRRCARRSRGAPTPARSSSIDGAVPRRTTSPTRPRARPSPGRSSTWASTAGTPLRDIAVDTVFIGSCTNSRIEDLRAAAAVLDGRHVTAKRVMVVPGSHAVKAQAEAEGLDRVFLAAGADWREPGCSMCLAMNPDKLAPGERAASTSNRNFEGRQGRGGRTHLVSPAVAAATAVAGHFADAGGPVDEGRPTSSPGTGVPLQAVRRRHRPDHPGRVAEAGRAHRVREGPVRDVARRPRLRAQRRALRRRVGPRRRAGVRRRLVARARRVGDPAGRLRRRDRAELLATSSATTARRTASCPSSCRSAVVERIWEAIDADPQTQIIVDVERLLVEVPVDRARRAVPDGRLGAGALPRGPRRHRHHARPRRRDRRLRGHPPAWLPA